MWPLRSGIAVAVAQVSNCSLGSTPRCWPKKKKVKEKKKAKDYQNILVKKCMASVVSVLEVVC